VLHDVFDFPFEKVAPMVGRTVAACRQLASRARKRVEEEAGAGRFSIDPVEQRRVVDAFIAACAGGDMKTLLPLLDPSVVGWADLGGGRTLPGVSRPNVGREMVGDRVMRFFGAESGNQLVAKVINGEPSVVAILDGAVASVLALSVTDGLISRIYVVSDPRKLAHVKRVLEQQR
jgi:RNA polymerase sigma-70 factor (ECF subfamily)